MARHILHTTIKKSLRERNGSPKRTIRNLVELAENFSVGSQLEFFRTVRSMLKSEACAYYSLWEALIRETDHDSLRTFGINVGYNGCAAASGILRAASRKHLCGIPSILTIVYDGRKMDCGLVDSIVRQGETLGIHTYIVSDRGGNPVPLSTVFTGHRDSGFVVLTDGNTLCPDTVSKLTLGKNVMLSVSADAAGFEESCERLKKQRVLYCVHTEYDENRADEILSGLWVGRIESLVGTFALLIPREGVSEIKAAMVGAFAYSCRMEQRYPLILIDYGLDLPNVNRIVSSRSCLAGFDADGQLITEKGRTLGAGLNIISCSLLDVFSRGLAI